MMDGVGHMLGYPSVVPQVLYPMYDEQDARELDSMVDLHSRRVHEDKSTSYESLPMLGLPLIENWEVD